MPVTTRLAAELSAPSNDPKGALASLHAKKNLSDGQSEHLFGALVRGELSDIEITAMLVTLRLKGETTDELIGAARALRTADLPFPRPDYLFADSCGTGGDGSSSINVSTAAAFVAAAAGLPVAKHGNRSFSSRCGSADVLEALGAKLNIAPEKSRAALDQSGVCFLFAPLYHPGLEHAGPARRALGVRTIMNLLGPCLNPAEPPVQLLGVADASLLEPIASTLHSLGVHNAMVAYGSGLDEVALHDETMAVRLGPMGLEHLVLSPEDAGLERAPLETIRGGDPEENATRLKRVLEGRAPRAETDLVSMNAGALLMTAGLAPAFRDGVAQAADVLRSGEAAKVLKNFIEATHA